VTLFEDGKGPRPGPEPEYEYNEGLEKAAFRDSHNIRRSMSDEECEQEMDELIMKMDEMQLEKESKAIHKPG